MKRPTKEGAPARPADDPQRMNKSGRLNVAELKKALKAAEEKNSSSPFTSNPM
jgi:hypothetical protein